MGLPGVSPAHSAPEICSIDLRKRGICLAPKIALRNYTHPNWPLRQCQVAAALADGLSKRRARCARRGDRERIDISKSDLAELQVEFPFSVSFHLVCISASGQDTDLWVGNIK